MSLVWHPWSRLEPAACSRGFAAAAAVALGLAVALWLVDRPLRATGNGIVSLALAGDRDAARTILASWGESGRVLAAFGLGLDYLFLVAYALALSLGCVAAAGWWQRAWVLTAAGPALAWGAFFAGLLDAVENYALAQGLFGAQGAWWPVTAWWCAAPKFALVGLALAYIGLGGVARLVRRRGPTRADG